MSLQEKCYKPNKVEFSLGSGNKFVSFCSEHSKLHETS